MQGQPSHEPPIIPAERIEDLIGLEHAEGADLVLFMAGNQFMAVPDLLSAFQRANPKVKKIFCETLPPGMELKQILAGRALFQGQSITAPPDVYTSVSQNGVDVLVQAGLTRTEDCFVYLHNRIVLMVEQGNPLGISSVRDMGKDEVRISQPRPEYEDIAYYIINMYRQAGGEALIERIMVQKKEKGSTLLTTVHHRETPARIMAGAADAGPVWATEAVHAQKQNLPLWTIEFGPDLDQRDQVKYFTCPITTGRNPENGRKFLQFLLSDEARTIYRNFGFTPAE